MLTLWKPRRNSMLPSIFNDAFFDDYQTENFIPNVDIVENKKEIQVKMDVPGVDKEDLKVELKNGVLTISGERKRADEQEEGTCYRSERVFGSFSRAFNVGDLINEKDINASFKNGTLTVKLPKPAEKEVKKIEIH